MSSGCCFQFKSASFPEGICCQVFLSKYNISEEELEKFIQEKLENPDLIISSFKVHNPGSLPTIISAELIQKV